METSDDPFFWVPDFEQPETTSTVDATTNKTVDERLEHQKDKKKRKFAPSIFTGDWDEPVLGQPGLLGLPGGPLTGKI